MSNAMSNRRASVTIDGIEYVLPCDGQKITNTTGRTIPAGATIYWTNTEVGGVGGRVSDEVWRQNARHHMG